jgi:hypothetical protein
MLKLLKPSKPFSTRSIKLKKPLRRSPLQRRRLVRRLKRQLVEFLSRQPRKKPR